MAKITPTEKFYRQLLESLDVETFAEDSTLLYAYEDDGSSGPIKLDGKEVVLPTTENLKQDPEFWKTRVAFHPLNEQTLRGETKIFRTLQSLINWKLIKTLSYISHNLTLIAAHPEISKNLNPKQHVLLDALPDANKKTTKFVKDITEASFTGGPTKRLIKTFIKRGGIYNGKKHSAVLITTFSMFEGDNIDFDKRTILGVKAPRKGDMEAIPDLFKLILPKSSEGGEYYNAPSTDETAPRLNALLKGYANITERLNHALHTYGDLIEGYEEHIINLDWMNQIDNFETIRHDIPPLRDSYVEDDKSTNEVSQSSKKIRTGHNTNELEHSSSPTPSKIQKSPSSKTPFNKPNKLNSSENSKMSNGQPKQNTKRKNTMSFDPMTMMQLMANNNNGSSMDPMMMMMQMMGGEIDPMTMMMMNQGKGNGGMDAKTLMMMNAMKDGGGDMNPMLMMQLMNGDSDIDPMMLMMMNQGKDGGSKMNPMLMAQLMNGDSDIDPMMLMAMSGGEIDPMMLMMMNQGKDKDKKGGKGGIDPMMLMMMNQGKDGGDNKMNPMLMMQLMNGDSDIDPMMLAMMSGGDIDPMTLMMLSQNKKAKKGETITPKQPAPSYPES